MALDPACLDADFLAFLTERHLATLTTLRPDGSPHVVPVGFTYDPGARIVRVITGGGSRKAHNVRAGTRAAVCQVDGARWATLEGPAVLRTDPASVARAVAAYTERYRPPRANSQRVVVEITVDRIMGRA